MESNDVIKTIPIGSILLGPEEDDGITLRTTQEIPVKIKNLLSAMQTGAYIRGIAKEFQLPDETASRLAYTVLRIGIGKITLAAFASTLSTELKLPNDKAQKMAAEIQKDLFDPIMPELNAYLAKKKQEATGIMQHGRENVEREAGGAKNVLDLRTVPQPPKPPQIPK